MACLALGLLGCLTEERPAGPTTDPSEAGAVRDIRENYDRETNGVLPGGHRL